MKNEKTKNYLVAVGCLLALCAIIHFGLAFVGDSDISLETQKYFVFLYSTGLVLGLIIGLLVGLNDHPIFGLLDADLAFCLFGYTIICLFFSLATGLFFGSDAGLAYGLAGGTATFLSYILSTGLFYNLGQSCLKK